MHKNAQKVEWKTQSKIFCHYTWLLRGQICPCRWGFLRSFLTASKPSGRPITAAKRKEKEKKEKKKIQKSKSPSPNVVNRDASGKKGKLLFCKCHLDQIKASLAEIQPENHQNIQKTHFWQKAPGVNEWTRHIHPFLFLLFQAPRHRSCDCHLCYYRYVLCTGQFRRVSCNREIVQSQASSVCQRCWPCRLLAV